VSAGVCNAGRAGTAATGFGLAAAAGGVDCAWADAPKARDIKPANIEVADGTDLMTSPDPDVGVIEVPAIKHIWLVGTNSAQVQGIMAAPRRADAKDIIRSC
jgi:hypothetical protein